MSGSGEEIHFSYKVGSTSELLTRVVFSISARRFTWRPFISWNEHTVDQLMLLQLIL
jgi:hypothetical protein